MAAAFGVRRLVAAFRLKKTNEKRRELADSKDSVNLRTAIILHIVDAIEV
jgi:hypothetical protein